MGELIMKIKRLKLISSFDSLILSVLIATPEQSDIKGILQFSHGMTEHKERYLKTFEFFTERGYICIIHDHRGHGESVKKPEDLGYFYENGSKGIVEDFHQVSKYIKHSFPNLPIYLIAHSMGTLVARVCLKKYDYLPDGVFLCGSPSHNEGTIVAGAVLDSYAKIKGDTYRDKVINDLFVGIFDFNFKDENQKNAWISSDKKTICDYTDDPLCGFSFTINGYKALIDLMYETYSNNVLTAKKPTLPIMFLSGAEDSCMSGRKKFMEAVSRQQEAGYCYVGHHLYEGMRHEILNEPNKETVYLDILKHINVFEYMKNIL